MKRSAMVAQPQATQHADPTWDRLIEMVKGLPVDQRLKFAENTRQSALNDIKLQQDKLKAELQGLESLTGQPTPTGARPARVQIDQNASTVDRVLAALRNGGNKTVKMLQDETGTPWVNAALSQLLQSRQIVKDGNRPAGYSLK